MRKALTITLVAALALIVSGAAYANYCARDIVPASTLLVPFARQAWTFVDDPADDNYPPTGADEFGTPADNGYATLLAVTNVSSDAQIIHITVWSPTSIALLDFDQALSGYDVWSINFKDMLANNPAEYATSLATSWKANINIARPAAAGPDKPTSALRQTFEWGPDGRSSFTTATLPGILVNPKKTSDIPSPGTCFVDITSYPDYNYDLLLAGLEIEVANREHWGCDWGVPGLTPNYIPDGTPDQFVRAEFNDTWVEHIADSRIADKTGELWFYVTVDVVKLCNLDFYGSSGYFQNTYKNVNVLIGDIIYLDDVNNFSDFIAAVHIETDPLAVTGRTSYNVWENFAEEKALVASDHPYDYLEPLATAFGFRYAQGFANVMMWKNQHQINEYGDVDDCGDYLYFSWDEDEHSLSRRVSCQVSPCGTIEGYDPNVFPFETQIVPLTTKNFDLVDTFGWMMVVFSPSYPFPWGTPGALNDPTPSDETVMATQAWAGLQFTFGTYSAAQEAATLANANCFSRQIGPVYGINYPYVHMITE